MEETFYRMKQDKSDHTTYGGKLSLFDFEGHYTLSSMADKIMSDFKFDEQCRKNLLAKNF